MRRGEVDALTFTSSSTVTNLCDLLGDLPAPQPLVASIGPVTSKTALERGLRVDVEAGEHTIDGLVDALSAFATPKSVTSAKSSLSITLSGFMSRCTTPCLCA